MYPEAKALGTHGAEAKEAAFSAWSTTQGITTNGTIGYRRIPGHGFGIIAQRHIEAGQELVNVPPSALFTIADVPAAFRRQHASMTVHGLLASFLAFRGSVERVYAPWAATWPTVSDFRESMPLCWPQQGKTALTSALLDETMVTEESVLPMPPAVECSQVREPGPESESRKTCGFLQVQRRKLQADWKLVSTVFSDASFEKYLYYWLLVNTRSFYYEVPNVKTQPSREDRIALCPWIDLFNHNDSGCAVHFGSTGFTVTSDKAYEPGDEIYVSYGPHSNDFLLVEYGFLLDNNRWDSTPIDHILMSYLVNTLAEEQLQKAGYLGKYTVTCDGLCWRTEVAVRTQTLLDNDWERFVRGSDVYDVDDKKKAEAFIQGKLLEPFYQEAEKHIGHLQNAAVILARPRQTLLQRWTQIRALLRQAMDSLPLRDSGRTESRSLSQDLSSG